MRLHELRPAEGSRKAVRRIGRGQGSTKGGTSARGHKGAQSRTGYSAKRGFEGGQMPLMRRLPKFGFKNPFRVEYNVVNLEQLQTFLVENPSLKVVDAEFLRARRIISKNDNLIKILGRGELNGRLTVKAHKFSKSAAAAIKNAGGEAIVYKPEGGEVNLEETAQ